MVRKLGYLASSHNRPHERLRGSSKQASHAPCAQALPNLSCAFALFALLFFALATDALGQSGRRTQPTTSPSSTQRPRRATTPRETSPASTTTQTSSTTATKGNTPAVLSDDAPPLPRPKPTPQQTASADLDEEVGPEDVVRITSSLVTVPASVVDAYGRAVTGLKLEDFELRVDGQVKTISELSYSDTPVRLALLFDNSSSLTAAREFEKQAAVRFFRQVMRPVDQAAIYNVYTEVELAQPLTGDVRALVRTIENFGKPEGATRLFDAIVQAAQYLRPQAARKVIVIVSDGEDTLSDTDFEETLRIAQAADCQIYVVQTKQIEYLMQTGQPLGSANLRSLAAERRLQEFAAQTGGAVYSPLAVNELEAAFAQISADLSQQYVLSYYPSDDRQDGRFRSISLRVPRQPNARVRARKGYYASRAAMKSGMNWQAGSTGSANAAVINQSDVVPKESAGESISSNTASVRAATEIKVISSTPARPQPTSQPAQAQPLEPSPSKAQPAMQSSTQPGTSPQASQPQASQSENSQASTQRSAPEPSNAQTPTQVSGGVLNGKALSLPKPEYSATARAANASGLVVVEVTVDEAGKVIAARALSGHPMLRSAAVAAARLARFAPTKLSGTPVKVAGIITYNFVR